MTSHPLGVYALVAGSAFLLTLVLVPACRWLALKLDIVDRPSEARKVHSRTIPYLGGLPFYLGFLWTVLALELFHPQYSQPYLYPMCFVGTLIVLMGLYDDARDMSSLKKLLIELVLGIIMFYWGFRTSVLSNPFGGTMNVELLAVLITPLWIAGCINAINFSDGLDGLAGGLVFICAASIFAISYSHNQILSCILMAYLMGTTLGFLRYNFNPASIFMGDTGALFLGFVLGASTIIQEQKGVAVIALAVPMMVLGVPIIDTVMSFYRRLKRVREGQFFAPDRNHLHHRLLNLGLTQRQVVLSLYFFSMCLGLMAFILSVAPLRYSFLIVILAAMAIGFGVLVLRYIEGLSQR